ncbi:MULTISPECIES: hypothetical protein [unclassified Streptomyces]|uniref:hypothetical protein n=1 Tax=unclassified Streptomyces TaxID=2593676 RepID=UPI0006B05A39|nr:MULTISPECIES: hypothetical protein [unclassified Streptomyces]KOX37240.1 hypothetical protein ADL06_03650 [Streptomyces sp. NRRL F-6491]KOX41001.1 hypothetical protein ADL08_20820 [Streptomyces sp. NRRL F-6492]
MADRSKAEVVLRLFGVNLEQQGRGFYVPLEMLAIARGVYLAHQEDPEKFAGLLDDGAGTAYKRTSHDLARRIATKTRIVEGDEELGKAVELDSPETMETLHALFSSLLVEIPGRRSQPSWFGAHIYPFVGELIHYDAVERRVKQIDTKKSAKKRKQATKVAVGINAPSIERYLFRDGGSWAYKVLRADLDPVRKEATRQGLRDLVQDSETPLGNLAKALSAHDFDYDEAPVEGSDTGIELYEDLSPWPNLLREGTRNIVTRTTTVPRAKRTESLMHWVPYCLARHQLHLARTKLGATIRESILLDFGNEATPLRRESQKNLAGFRNDIINAINIQAQVMISEAEGDEEKKRRYQRFTKEGGAAVASPRAFFSETLAAVGALNATSGRRHFTMKPPMLEALVSATVAQDAEMEFDKFCTLLYEKYGLVMEDKVAAVSPLAYEVDPSVLDHNGKAFREKLAAIGLLTQYSDATSMVRGEPR